MNPSLNVVHLSRGFMEDELIIKLTVCMKEHCKWFTKTILLRLTLSWKKMSFSVHDRNIQQLALEMYKVAKGLATTAISSLFLQCSNNRQTTRSQSDFSIPPTGKYSLLWSKFQKVFRVFNMELNPNCFEKCWIFCRI